MKRLLDANVFIQAEEHRYGFDFCPAFGEWLVDRNSSENVFSIKEAGYVSLRDATP